MSPASAPEPSGIAIVEPADLGKPVASRSSIQKYASRWWPRYTGWARCRWVYPGIRQSGGAGEVQQAPHERPDEPACARGVLAEVEREVRRHLVVARAGRVELAPERSHDLREPPLDRHMDVLIVGDGGE